MSSRAEMCRQKAAEAKQSAAKAKNPFIKRAFEEVAAPNANAVDGAACAAAAR